MEIRKMLVNPSKYDTKCPCALSPKYITVHNTYNDATANNEVAYMIRNNNEVSFHIAVDDKEAVQGLPLNRNAWHCGDGSGNGNRKSIGVEICYSLSGGARYYKAEDNAAVVIAQLMKEFNIPIQNVRTHQSWNGKYCPHRMLAEGRWNSFIERVKRAYNGSSTSNVSSESNDKPAQPKGIGKAVSKYQEGYGVNLYTKPVSGFYNGRISDKTSYLILAGAWYGGDQNMLCLGGEQWAEQKHFDVQWFKAYSKYPAGYGINTYSKPGAPGGSFKGQVDGAAPLDIYSRENGWIDIGNQTFVEEKHFDIK